MLTAFGWFWFGEGIGIRWPYADAAILALMALLYAFSVIAIRTVRRLRRSGAAGLQASP
jgi:uncharacterized membrane protein